MNTITTKKGPQSKNIKKKCGGNGEKGEIRGVGNKEISAHRVAGCDRAGWY